MAEEITKYTVAVEFDSALKKLASFEKKMNAFSSKQEKALGNQIRLQRQLNNLRAKGLSGRPTKGGGGASIPSTPSHKPSSVPNDDKRLRNLTQAKNTLKRSALWLDKGANAAEREAKAALMSQVSKAKSADEVKNMVAMTRSRLREMKKQERSLKKQNFLMQRMKSSSKQIAGNMLSAFAVAAVGAGVVRTGQQFEGVESGLLAVSGTAVLAADNLRFVREESFRLGKPLKESADAFTKMLAARGNLSVGDVKKTFTSIQEVAVVLGLSADEANRGTRAIAQMMSKGRVTAEELRLQLAEAGFANAIPEMVKSAQDIGLISKNLGLVEATTEFFNLQQQGKVITEEILPAFSKRMKEFASGGLAQKLKGNTVAMGKLMNTFEDAARIIFQTDFGEGLTEFFNVTANAVKELSPLWETLGKIFGSVFKGLAAVIQAVKPALTAWSIVLDNLTDTLGDFSGALLLVIPIMNAFVGSSLGLGAVGAMFRKILAPILAVSSALQVTGFWLEEILNFVNKGDKVGFLFDPRTQEGHKMFDPAFAGKAKGDITEASPTKRLAKAGRESIERFNKDPSLSDAAGIFQTLPFVLKDLAEDAAISTLRFIGIDATAPLNNKEPVNVNVVIGADAEKLGLTISTTSSIQDAIMEGSGLSR